jgi:hypothetical protein
MAKRRPVDAVARPARDGGLSKRGGQQRPSKSPPIPVSKHAPKPLPPRKDK